MTYRADLAAALQRVAALEQEVEELERARARDRQRIADLEAGRRTATTSLEEALIAQQHRVKELEAQLAEVRRPPSAEAQRRRDSSSQATGAERAAKSAPLAFALILLCLSFIGLAVVCSPTI